MEGYELKRIEADSVAEMWQIADGFFPTDYTKDEYLSKRSGHDVYTSIFPAFPGRIDDFGIRLEINFGDGNTLAIWLSKYALLKDRFDELERKYLAMATAKEVAES